MCCDVHTYGHVRRQLAVTDIPKSYCLRGNKNYTAAEVSKLVGLNSRGRRAVGVAKQSPQQAAARFLLGMEHAQFSLEQILEDLQPDPVGVCCVCVCVCVWLYCM